jgi:hypothetical protein
MWGCGFVDGEHNVAGDGSSNSDGYGDAFGRGEHQYGAGSECHGGGDIELGDPRWIGGAE